jgi:adenylate kinase
MKHMLNLILIGPPGSGKGTQSARLACRFNLVHLSTGDLFRREVKQETSLGNELSTYMKSGLLVPDQLVLARVFRAALEHPLANGFVFDGFPRTLHQARMLDRTLQKKGLSVNIVFLMLVDEDELVKRILSRAHDSGRDDDNATTINTRMDIYHTQARLLAGYYEEQNKLIIINSMEPVKEVSEKIAGVVQYFLEKNELLSFQ